MTEEVLMYIDGELEGDLKKNFESRLQHDAALKSAYETVMATKKLSEGIIEAEIYGYLRSTSRTKSINDPVSITKSPSKYNVKWIAISLVAAACSLLFLYVNFNGKLGDDGVTKDAYALYYAEPVWSVSRGDASGPIDLLVARYRDNDKSVIDILLHTDAHDKDYFEKKYWAAEMLLQEKRVAEASVIADELLKAKMHVSRCHYIKVMDLLVNKDKADALQYIKNIPPDDLEVDEKKRFKKMQNQ